MKVQSGTPFDTIESAHAFVALLAKTVKESRLDIEGDVQREAGSTASRRLDALRMALYNLEKLESHMNQSRRILNDLRSLRRLLFEERATAAGKSSSAAAQKQGVTAPARGYLGPTNGKADRAVVA